MIVFAASAHAQLPLADSLKQGSNVNGWKFSGGDWKFEAGGLHARNTTDIDHANSGVPKGIFDYAYLPGVGADMILSGKITLIAIDPNPKFVRVGLAAHMTGAGDITDKKWMFMYARVQDTDNMAPVLLEEGVAWRKSDPNMTQVDLNKVYDYKMQVMGTDVKGRLWPDGQAEPADWQVEDMFSTAQIKNTAIGLLAVGVEAVFSDISAVPLPDSKLGTLSGKIQDTSGGVVGGAVVTATGSMGAIVETISRPDGSYGFQLMPDTYDLRATSEGYAPGAAKGIKVAAGPAPAGTNVPLTQSYPSINKASAPIMVDGNLDPAEWGDANPVSINRKEQVVTGADLWKSTDDESGTVMLKWDASNLYVGARILDATPGLNTQDPSKVFNGDALEVAFQLDGYDPKRAAYDTTKNYQLVVGLGTANSGAPTWGLFQNGKYIDLGDPTGQIAVMTTSGFTRPGYTVEVALPWSALPGAKGAPPTDGQGAAFDVALDGSVDAASPATIKLVYNSQSDYAANPAHLVPSQWAPVGGAVVAVAGGSAGGILGDVNGDGKVDIKDATLSLGFAVTLKSPDAAQMKLGDVNHDGKLDIKDTTMILKFALGLITAFPG